MLQLCAIMLTILSNDSGKSLEGNYQDLRVVGYFGREHSPVLSHSSWELTLDKGTIVMIILLITSLDRIRIATYESFLIAHIVLSIITLVGCF